MKRSERGGEHGHLERYHEMRDFSVTAEPRGAVLLTSDGNSFVVQKHDATRLHYDFRLELDGVLKSWAVPKGPSLSPRDRRLAVETEDHPVDYREFEGTIPDGEYGGGPVIVWDRGRWTPLSAPREGLAKGRLEFELEGEKLRGKYSLVRLAEGERSGAGRAGRNETNWLLMKRKDEHVRDDEPVVEQRPESVLSGRTIEDIRGGVPARRRPPRSGAKRRPSEATRDVPRPPALGGVRPELAMLVDAVPTVGRWLYELKYDGYRILARRDGGEVTLASRNGKDWTAHFPEIAAALAHVRVKNAIFDGEVAHVLPDGRTDFQNLQNTISGRADRSRLVYFVFDLLFYDGEDLRSEPLTYRKDRLRTVLAGEGPPLKLGDHMDGDGEALFREACRVGLEGIIAKRADAPYREGRGRDWLKVKCQKRQELVIVGFTPPKGRRKGIGALLLGIRDKDSWRYAGKVGTGFSQASLEELRAKLDPLVASAPAVHHAPRMKDATWVRPELVCQVHFTEWTREGVLRHPAFEGLRDDKKATAVHREEAASAPEATEPKRTAAGGARSKRRSSSGRSKDGRRGVQIGGVEITHPDRVVDPASGVTKEELARYHAAVARRFMPLARERPLMLLRCPEGSGRRDTCFVQKHSGRGLGARLGRTQIDGEEVLFIERESHVLELVQFNAVELHGWGSRVQTWDRPDWIVFDLDPDESLPFSRVADAAFIMKEELERLGLVSFVKTTGGKGLHVVVPLRPTHDWEVVKTFSAAMAHALVARAPRSFVATMSKAARRGKIFIDHFRNARGATAVLPWSPRARPGVTVATPVAWGDLRAIDPRELTVRTVPELLERRDTDPWTALRETRQTLSKRVLAALSL